VYPYNCTAGWGDDFCGGLPAPGPGQNGLTIGTANYLWEAWSQITADDTGWALNEWGLGSNGIYNYAATSGSGYTCDRNPNNATYGQCVRGCDPTNDGGTTMSTSLIQAYGMSVDDSRFQISNGNSGCPLHSECVVPPSGTANTLSRYGSGSASTNQGTGLCKFCGRAGQPACAVNFGENSHCEPGLINVSGVCQECSTVGTSSQCPVAACRNAIPSQRFTSSGAASALAAPSPPACFTFTYCYVPGGGQPNYCGVPPATGGDGD
jgi:hypothetical protein